MRQLPLAAAVTISLVMSGCGLFAGQEDDTPGAVVQPAAPQTFASPIVPARPKTRVAALIQPTNPNERLRAIKSGRADPFAALVPAGSGSQAAGGGGSSGTAGSASSSGTGASTAASPTTTNTITIRTGGSGQPTRGGSSSSPNQLVSGSDSGGSDQSTSGSQPAGLSPSVPSLPPLPQPELAQGVQVTGIAFVNGVPRAIVKAPDETVSRSVSAGDRLSNGQILVKRIETSGAEPVVILEQYGTEVAVGVGKPGVQLASAIPDLSGDLPPVPALWYGKGR